MRSFSLFACYLFVACTPDLPPVQTASPEPSPQSTSSTQPAPSTQPAVTQTPPAQPEITITSVSATNPVVIEGRARTFENNVVVRVRDAKGTLIAEAFTTAVGEMGNHNPYRAEVFVTREPGGKITVEALEYSARDGSERSLTSKTIAYAVEPVSVDLYFHDPQRSTDCSQVFPARRIMPKSVAMARLLVEALIADPQTAFPRGSAVRSVILRNGALTVDFNERLQNVGGSCAAQAIRASVTATLLRLPSIESVVITAGGSEKLALQP